MNSAHSQVVDARVCIVPVVAHVVICCCFSKLMIVISLCVVCLRTCSSLYSVGRSNRDSITPLFTHLDMVFLFRRHRNYLSEANFNTWDIVLCALTANAGQVAVNSVCRWSFYHGLCPKRLYWHFASVKNQRSNYRGPARAFLGDGLPPPKFFLVLGAKIC